MNKNTLESLKRLPLDFRIRNQFLTQGKTFSGRKRASLSRRRKRGCQGFTLIEVLVALAIGAAVLTGTVQVFSHYHLGLLDQQNRMTEQQELRLGLQVMGAELRMTGRGNGGGPPLLRSMPTDIAFLANLTGKWTSLSSRLSGHQVDLSVINGSGWKKGSRVFVCTVDRCLQGQLARTGLRNRLHLVNPLGGAFPSGSQVLSLNYVRYYLGTDSRGRRSIMRQVDGGANAFIGEVRTFHLTYYTREGMPTNDPGETVKVGIEVAVGRNTQSIRGAFALRG